jgi:hypothetical protein
MACERFTLRRAQAIFDECEDDLFGGASPFRIIDSDSSTLRHVVDSSGVS